MRRKKINTYDYIKSKQVNWALNQGIKLIGSEGDRGFPAYTPELTMNLFEPLLPEVRKIFENGDGNELGTGSGFPAKMQAVHSSSALGVNIFQYWQSINQVPVIAAACGFCEKTTKYSEKITFEEKFPAGFTNHKSPNIDVVIHNSDQSDFKVYAVECKFSEAYSNEGHGEFSPDYLKLQSVWTNVPALLQFAQTINPKDISFSHLYPAQLVKHILGMKAKYGKKGFKLLYLWYDAPGKQGVIHREEVERFTEVTKLDGVHFLAMTYQELILSLARDYRQDHPEYIHYLTERYL